MSTDRDEARIRLKALGYVELEDSGQIAVRMLKSPRQVAVFTAIALGESAIRSSDRLIDLFWPDSSPDRARHSLNQALHLIRRDLGEVVLRRGDDVLADPDQVWCDVAAFQEACREGRHADAVRLYRGDLLDGLYLSEAPDFEHWIDGVRQSLRGSAATAMWAHAEDLARAGALTEAARMARRAAELTVGEEASIRRLLRFLDAIGDRAGALAAFRGFREHMEREYEAAPSPETVAIVEEILARDETVPTVPRPEAPEVGAPPLPTVGASPYRTRPRVGPSGRRLVAIGALATPAAAVALALWIAPGSPPAPSRLLVFADGSVQERVGYAMGMVDPGRSQQAASALAAELSRVAALTVVPPSMVGQRPVPELIRSLDVGAAVGIEVRSEEGEETTVVQIVDADGMTVAAHRSFPKAELPVLARFVRQQLGDLTRTRRLRGGEVDQEALRRMAEADWLHAHGEGHARAGRSRLAWSFLLQADSVLRLAESLAHRDAQVAIQRGWVAHTRYLSITDGDRVPQQRPGVDGARELSMAVLDEVEAHANRAIALDPRSPFAYELRGAARLSRLQQGVPSYDSLAVAARQDLTEAVTALPGLSAAWTRLAYVYRMEGNLGAAAVATQRAIESDLFLAFDRATRWDLLSNATWAGDAPRADRACIHGRADFPDDVVFRECRLFIMSWIAGAGNPDEAWRQLDSLEASAGDDRVARRALPRAYVAGALALAGMADSARAVLRRGADLGSPPDSIAATAETVRVLSIIGDLDTAEDTLESLLRSAPTLRGMARTDPRFSILLEEGRLEPLLGRLDR